MPKLSESDKTLANHLFERVRIYDALIDDANNNGEFATAEQLEATQSEIRTQLRAIIGL